MRAAPLVLALLLPLVAAGCVLDEPGPRELRGEPEGYSPTAAYLKVHVKDAEGRVTLADFDRREWHAAEIARLLDRHRLDVVAVRGTDRLPGELVVAEVVEPAELAALRYEAMAVTPEERGRLDAQYDALLAARGLLPEAALDPEAPTPPQS